MFLLLGRYGLVALAGLLAATVAAASDAPPTAQDGPGYRIDAIVLEYLQDHPEHPPLVDVARTQVVLGVTELGYVAPRPGQPTVTLTIEQIAEEPTATYYASAVQTIILAVLDYFTQRGFMGVYVAPNPQDLTRDGRDLRAPDDLTLRLIITTGVISELRTLAAGDRIAPADRVNNPLHARLRDRSPLKPYSLSEGDSPRQDLLIQEQLDRYLYHLSRHPGRRVDAAVSASDVPGGVTLDYFVTENKPLTIYSQVSNTGTKQTGTWRYRFGLVDTQLTNADDILSLDFDTTFDDSYAFLGSYERPFKNDRWRWRAMGAWNQFAADEVGFTDLSFTGESWTVGGQLVGNVFQHRELFVDVVTGMRWLDERVTTRFGGDGDAEFLLGEVGVRLEHSSEWYRTIGSLNLEWTFTGLTDESDLLIFGRSGPDETWVLLRGFLTHSMFLEPLLNGQAWRDPTTPESSTLAHELRLAVSGQYAFGNRLIPQVQGIVGGLYTVRGYRQAAVAGDSTVVANFEYRYHIPRAFGIQAEPMQLLGDPFRVAPQYVYGRPDWDLVFKGFLDIGAVWQSRQEPFESNDVLIGAGIGGELLLRQNFSIRVDWGVALRSVSSADISSGSSQVYFVATLLF